MSNTTSYNFSKVEKLKSRKQIEQLFANGSSFLVFPVKVIFAIADKTNDEYPIKIGVSASSKKFKKAVDRNRIKRLLKENYRLNKLPLHQSCKSTNTTVAVFFIFIDKALPSNAVLQNKMPLIIEKLINVICEKSTLSS